VKTLRHVLQFRQAKLDRLKPNPPCIEARRRQDSILLQYTVQKADWEDRDKQDLRSYALVNRSNVHVEWM
jgi:hypothetical protein